jgi:hypothetical protein
VSTVWNFNTDTFWDCKKLFHLQLFVESVPRAVWTLIRFYKFLNENSAAAVLPDFSWYNIPKLGKNFQMTTNILKWPWNIPICRKIDQNDRKICQHLPLKDPQKFTKVEFLVWKYTIWQPWAAAAHWTEIPPLLVKT